MRRIQRCFRALAAIVLGFTLPVILVLAAMLHSSPGQWLPKVFTLGLGPSASQAHASLEQPE